MCMTEFKVGDEVRVTRKFETGEYGSLCWVHCMDEMVGKVYEITTIWGNGLIQLDGKYSFHPDVLEHVNKRHVAHILTEKIMVNGVKCRKILGFKGISQKHELPEKYTACAPSFHVDFHRALGAHVFNGTIMEWEHPSGSTTGLRMRLPDDVHIDVGVYGFTGMNVGDVWPETTFHELLACLKRAGSRLAEIRKQERESWKGKEEVEI